MKLWLGYCGLASLLISSGHPVAWADYLPITLRSDSYNYDVVVEKGAPGPLSVATTASMDTGTNNTGLAFYERGYNLDWPATGLPAPGVSFTSETATDHEYRLASDYRSNNAVLIDANQPDGAVVLISPGCYSALSFLVSGGNGGGTLNYTIHYADGSTQGGTLACPDWLHTLNAAWTSYGCVNVTAFTFYDLNANYPGIFGRDVALQKTGTQVTRVDFHFPGGAAHNAVFAVSGLPAIGEAFAPIALEGFNADLIVEATAARRVPLRSATTATIECGSGNLGYAWYEAGYYTPAPTSGFPAPGTRLMAASAAGHEFQLAPSYTTNNAVMLEAGASPAVLIPKTAAGYHALSFLGASSGGAITLGCEVAHGDGSRETAEFPLPDWLSSGPRALTVNAHVNLDFRTISLTNTSGLFAVDVPLTNSASPVSSVTLTIAAGSETARAVIMAVSGDVPRQDQSLSLKVGLVPGGGLKLSASGPGRLESTGELKGTLTVWRDEGAINGERIVAPAGGESARYYRVTP